MDGGYVTKEVECEISDENEETKATEASEATIEPDEEATVIEKKQGPPAKFTKKIGMKISLDDDDSDEDKKENDAEKEEEAKDEGEGREEEARYSDGGAATAAQDPGLYPCAEGG